MEYTKHPRGSVWNKWDLHLHSPQSGLANKYPQLADEPDWEKYISKLETLNDIPAIAITDYFLVDGYKKVLEFKKKGRLKNIDLILPNIEFRLDNIVGGKRINFHIIFSEKVSPDAIEDHFLSNIDFVLEGDTSSTGDRRKLKKASLVELGRLLKSQHEKFKGSEFEVGCTNAVVKLDEIYRLLVENKLFKDNFLAGVAEEGLSDMKWDGQDHHVRKTILRRSHIAYSANPETIKFYLGKKHANPKAFIDEFGPLKPCVFGSDAHELAKIGEGTDGKFTWIKGDLTFEGLRQTTFEAPDRVFIGNNAPVAKDLSKVIRSVEITCANGWFADQVLPLNQDLIAIIGGKGSGKTALLDLIAYAGGDFDGNESAFLKRAADEIEGTSISLEWADGVKDSPCIVGDLETCPEKPKVRYLSQSFVENLCSHDQHSKLVGQIEKILFQYVPNDKMLGAPDFVRLKEVKTQAIQLEISSLRLEIFRLNGEIFVLEKEIAKKESWIGELAAAKAEKLSLIEQKPPAANSEEQRDQDALDELRRRKASLEKTIDGLRLKVEAIGLLLTKLKLVRTEVEKFNVEVHRQAQSIGIVDQLESLVVSMPPHAENVFVVRSREIQAEIEALTNGVDPTTETLAGLGAKIREVESRLTMEAQQKRKLLEFGKRIEEFDLKTAKLEGVIHEIDAVKKAELQLKVKQRDSSYLRFFSLLARKRQVLEELYQPLNDSTEGSVERSKVEFYAKYHFNIKAFVTKGIGLFDGRKAVIRGDEGFRVVGDAFQKASLQNVDSPNLDAIAQLTSILDSPAKSLKEQIKETVQVQNVYDWIFDVDYFDVEYGIKYEGVDLDKLSPGRKGVVLLLIYLDIDRDFRPLLVDQPEENLDNRSVYSTLVEYFKKAKRSRQVILVTHNANLVVNADAEQVFVAQFGLEQLAGAPRIKYVSGSLEHRSSLDETVDDVLRRQGIREHVCEILEGGDEAFQRRESKYGFQRK